MRIKPEMLAAMLREAERRRREAEAAKTLLASEREKNEMLMELLKQRSAVPVRSSAPLQ